MKKIIAFLNKPLPDNVCWALGKQPPCKICWELVIMIIIVVTIAGLIL